MVFGLYNLISSFCDYGGPYVAPFIAPILNPLSWLSFIILTVAIYTGNNDYLSKDNNKKSFTKSLLNAFRINYLFHMLIVFFALLGTCGLKNNIENYALNQVLS